MNLNPVENALKSLINRVTTTRGTSINLQPVDVEISQLIALELMQLDVEGWRAGSNGFMQDNQIENLLSRIHSPLGIAGLNGLVVLGIRIKVTTDLDLTGVRIS